MSEHVVIVEKGIVFFAKSGEKTPRERLVYVARCSCGWTGKPFRISGDAMTEGTDHVLDAPDEREHDDGQRGT